MTGNLAHPDQLKFEAFKQDTERGRNVEAESVYIVVGQNSLGEAGQSVWSLLIKSILE